MTLWITVENGDIFEGTLNQFMDNFFWTDTKDLDAVRDEIKLWAKEEGYAVGFEELP